MAMRLIPFLSFDIVSYAAGLTPLQPWRFVLATLIGVTPVSFALAYFGGELASADFDRIELTVLAIGLVASSLLQSPCIAAPDRIIIWSEEGRRHENSPQV